MVANITMKIMFRPDSGCIALYAAGGTTSSDGKGMNELSTAMSSAMVP